MKKYFLFLFFSCIAVFAFSQEKPKPVKQPVKTTAPKQPSQVNMDKMLEDAMKSEGMSKEEQAEMKKYMKEMMPALEEHNRTTANYPEFSSNRQLVPKKDVTRINSMSKRVLTKTDVGSYANTLYTKLMTKGDPAEMAIVKKVIAQTPKAADIGSAAILAMLQGHPQAALALSIKAAATDPGNLNWQNNMAALLTSTGFPDQAIPVLRKLKNDLPNNSTVLNNLGHAWLGLGEPDSTKKYFSAALKANSKHPDALNGQGLMEEMNGNRESALQHYRESMQQTINPLTNQLISNSDDKKQQPVLELENLKQAIPYFEYFKKDWHGQLPSLSNSVYNYSEDKAILVAYKKMNDHLTDLVKNILDKLDDDLDQTTKKGEDEFVRIMTAESMKGLNMLSKPAGMIIGVLGIYMSQWQERTTKEILEIEKWKEGLVKKRDEEIAAIYKRMENSKGSCKQYKAQLDTLENQYLRTFNGRMRSFMVQKEDEVRHWFNMYCSWNWYVAGNVKNIILLQDYGFVGLLSNYTTGIITALDVRQEHCADHSDELNKTIPLPEMPNFDCRPVISVPAGTEWEELAAGIMDFDDNGYGLKKTGEPVPNINAAYGLSDLLAEPAIAPFVNTADGSVSPANYINPDDMEPSYYADEKYIPADPDTKPVPEQDTWGKERRTSRMIRELLGDMIQADCRGLKNSKDALREALARKKEIMRDRIYHQTDNLNKYDKLGNAIREERIKELLQQAKQTYENFIKDNNADHFLENADQLTRTLSELRDFSSARAEWELQQAFRLINNTQQDVWEAQNGPKVINKIEQAGLQVSISNGLQAPGTFKMSKDLFK
jgi:tetratricopeptide (TPR) repeat protein